MLLFGGVAAMLPVPCVRSGLQLARRCRRGLLAHADVTNVGFVLDAGEPRAVGRRIVHHPRLGDHEGEFDIGGPWIGSIVEGSTLDVLVEPDRPESWLTLGMHER